MTNFGQSDQRSGLRVTLCHVRAVAHVFAISSALFCGSAVPPAQAQPAQAQPADQVALQGAQGEKEAMAETEPLQLAFSDAYNAGNYAKALEILKKALEVWQKKVGPNHPIVGNLRVNCAELMRQLGRLQEAEVELEAALAVLQTTLGPEHAQTLVAHHNLGALQLQRGRVAQAVETLEKVLVLLVKVRGEGSLEVAQARMHLADSKLQQGKLAEAKALYEQVMRALESAKPPSAEHLAIAYNNRAKLKRYQGDLPGAEDDLSKAALILGKVFGMSHPSLAMAAINLADLRMERGDLGLAEEALIQAIRLSASALGPEHPQVGHGAVLLANLYRTRGEHDRAKKLYAEALPILEHAYGPQHPALAEALNHQGVLALQMADDALAGQLLDRSWKILVKPGQTPPQLAITVGQNLAVVLERTDRADQAAKLYAEAIAACDQVVGADQAACAPPRYNLGLLHLKARRLPQAQQWLQASLLLREKALGPHHPDVARSLAAVAAILDLQGKLSGAADLMQRAVEIRDRQLALMLGGGAEGPKRALVATLGEERDIALDLLLRAGRPAAALELVLQRKGRALEATVDGLRGVGADSQAAAELSAARGRLAALYARGPVGQPAEVYAAALQEAGRRAEELERRAVARFGPAVSAEPLHLADLQARLRGGTLLELFVRKPLSLKKPESAQAPALVTGCLLGPKGPPVCRDLGPAAELEGLALQVRRAAMLPTGDVDKPGAALRQAVIDPFAAELKAVKQLLVAPDGALHLVPFAALPAAAGGRLLQQYTLSYLTSGRDLLRMAATPAQPVPRGQAVLIGAPGYDQAAQGDPTKTQAVPQQLPAPGRRAAAGLGRFSPLPGTAEEAAQLAALWPKAQVWSGAAASEKALRGVRGPELLHIATHGFFLADKADPVVEAVRGGRRGAELWGEPPAPVLPEPGRDDPLLRSGIALAGANQPPQGDDDGVMTALEVAGLDLVGTRLAVLSACETGVGDVKNGEGVFGLRRALVLAGAETQVMSLWKVDDLATRDLMVALHQKLLGHGGQAPLGRAEALRQAQLLLAKDPKRSHPFWWAAFILSGEWRALPSEPGGGPG